MTPCSIFSSLWSQHGKASSSDLWPGLLQKAQAWIRMAEVGVYSFLRSLLAAYLYLVIRIPENYMENALAKNSPDSFSPTETQSPQLILIGKISAHPFTCLCLGNLWQDSW